MPADNRVTYRRRHSYRTSSNQIKIVKTPGGKNVVHYRTKIAKGPKCGDCGTRLSGIPCLRPIAYSRLPKHSKKVARPYGGSRCNGCVRNRIVRAFLIEEQKIVKHVLKRQTAKPKPTKEEAKKGKGKAAAKTAAK